MQIYIQNNRIKNMQSYIEASPMSV